MTDQDGLPLRLHDCGATHHFRGKRDLKLTSTKPSHTKIVNPNGSVSTSTKEGNLGAIEGVIDTDFRQTLLSWNQFIKENPRTAFVATNTDVRKVRKQDLLKIPSEIVGIKTEGGWAPTDYFVTTGLGFLDQSSIEHLETESAANGAGLTDGKPIGQWSDIRRFHARWNHPGISYFKALAQRSGLGFKNSDIDAFYQGPSCRGCCAGKIQKSKSKVGSPKIYDEIWMMDILGQYHPDIDGNVWTVVFVEGKTGYVYIHHLKTQKQFETHALPAWLEKRRELWGLRDLETNLRGIIGDRVTKLRADNAKVFKHGTSFYSANAIIYEACAPGKDDHVAKAEAAIKTLQRMALASLGGAKLDLTYTDANGTSRSLYSHALDMAAHMKNMWPYHSNDMTPPYEAATGKPIPKITWDSLRTPFASVYCKKDTTNSRMEKFRVGIFVGYGALGTYKVFYPDRLALRAGKRRGPQSDVYRLEKNIVWDESGAHTTNRFEELRRYREYTVLYGEKPVPTKQVDRAVISDRVTRSTSSANHARAIPPCYLKPPPKNWKAAMSRPDAGKWQEALQYEMTGLEGKFTRHQLKDLPPDAKILRGSAVYKVKFSSEHGATVYDKHRYRVVANNTLAGLPTFSPTVAFTPFLMLLTVAAKLDIDVWAADVAQAYGHTKIPDDHPPIYMRPPKEVRKTHDEVWRLRCALYGLEEAGRLFYMQLRGKLQTIGFQESRIFAATYAMHGKKRNARMSKFERKGIQFYVATWVDDIFLICPDDDLRREVMDHIKTVFKIGAEDRIQTTLGLEITRDREAKTISISCGAKIRAMTQKYGLDHLPKVDTPHYSRAKYSMSECPPAGEELDKMEYPYLSLLMTVAWMAIHCRVDLLYIVSIFRQFQKNPSINHWKGLVRVVQFLASTPDQTMLIGAGQSPLEVFYDASFADREDGHSTGAFLVRMYGTPIMAWAKKLSFADHGKVATSTSKAEAKTAVVASEAIDVCTNYLHEMKIASLFSWSTQRYNGQGKNDLTHLDYTEYPGLTRIPFYGDNKAVVGALTGETRADCLRSIQWSVKPEGSFKAGIIFLRESAENNDIMPMYVCDVDNVVDVNTKRKDPQTFAKHSKVLRGHTDVDFTSTIEIERQKHKDNTRRKQFVRKPTYDSTTLKVQVPSASASSARLHTDSHQDYEYDYDRS